MPDLKLGNTDITTVKLGSTQVDKVYLGSNLIWSSWAPSDPDAITYINKLNSIPGVTLTQVEQQAVDNLFIRMKGQDPNFGNYGNTMIWDRRIALYPYVGSNMEAFRYNAFVPVTTNQTDGSGNPISPGYQTFYGGGTYDSYGHKGNGINSYANTNLNHTNGYLASKQGPGTGFTMGIVWKDTLPLNRSDFGVYSTFFPNDATMWLTNRSNNTKPYARILSYDQEISGPTVVTGGKGHWLIVVRGTVGLRKAYYQGTEVTLSANQARNQVPTQGWSLSYLTSATNFNGGASNFTPNTNMFFYIFNGFDTTTIIDAWNAIVEAFCVETGKKTW